AGEPGRLLSRRCGGESHSSAGVQHPQVHPPPRRGRPAAAAREPPQYHGREGLVGRYQEPRRVPGRRPAVVRARRLGLAAVRRPRAGVRRGRARGGVLRRPGVRRHSRGVPGRRPHPGGEAAGASRAARQGDRGQARAGGREGGDGRRGRGPVRRTGARAAGARRRGGPGARRQARRRVTDYRGLLAELAVPRLAGTLPAEQVRAVLKRELAARGFVVMEHRFTGRSLLHRLARVPLAGVNLIAVRPRPRSPARVATWLVAHYDSKGQPLSMAARLGAAALAGAGAVELLGLALRAVLGGAHPSLLDGVLGGAGVVGAALLAVNRVTDRSAGAVDNAAGVITAFATVVHTLRDTAARLTLDGARRVAGGVAAALFPG